MVILEDCRTFIQYELFNSKLLTLIGEFHSANTICQNPKISVSAWTLDVLNKNKNAKVFLEYNQKYGNPRKIGSKPINDIYNTLNKENRLNVILPFDLRAEFITKRGQDILYHGDDFDDFDDKEISEKFLEPFYNKKLSIIHDPATDSGMLVEKYYQEIYNEFALVKTSLKEGNDDIREMFKYVWLLLTDYPVIATISNPDRKETEYVLIAGDNHVKNIAKFLNNANFARKLNIVDGGKNMCAVLP